MLSIYMVFVEVWIGNVQERFLAYLHILPGSFYHLNVYTGGKRQYCKTNTTNEVFLK